MNTNLRSCMCTFALVALLAIPLSAETNIREYVISTKLGGNNIAPAVACDQSTGAVLVTWEHSIQSGNRIIYCCLCTPKADGTWKIGKSLPLSAADQRCLEPSVSYNEVTGNYLVVWGLYSDPSGKIFTPAVMARPVSRTGKPQGNAVKVYDKYGTFNRYPKVTSTAPMPKAPGPFIVAWSYDDRNNTNNNCCRVAFLAKDGSLASTPVLAYKPADASEPQFYLKPYSIITTARYFYLTLTHSVPDDVDSCRLVWLTKKGTQKKNIALNTTTCYLPYVVSLSKKLFLTVWQAHDEYRNYYQLFAKNLKNKSSAAMCADMYVTCSRPSSIGAGGACVVMWTPNQYFAVWYTNKGALLERLDRIKPEISASNEFDAVYVDKSGQVFIACNEFFTDTMNAVIYNAQ